MVASELAKINQIRLRKLLGELRMRMSAVSTHVLDTVARRAGQRRFVVRLERAAAASSSLAAASPTPTGGSPTSAWPRSRRGTYRLVFDTGGYLAAAEPGTSGERVLPRGRGHLPADGLRPRYHVPLLLSPYSYSTYRGS